MRSDAFTRREKGSEDMWIKQEEKSKYVFSSEVHQLLTYANDRLLALKERLQAQKKHIEELDKHMYA